MKNHLRALPAVLLALGMTILGCEDGSIPPDHTGGNTRGYFLRENSPGVTLTTDAPDYAPGETAVITGGGFQPGEEISMQVLHADGTPSNGEDHEPWLTTADDNGNLETTWDVCTDDCVGALLIVTAEGYSSGLYGETTFTDAPPALGSGRVSNVTPVDGGCVRQDNFPVNSVESWDVQEGKTYVVTLRDVTDCANGGTDPTIEVIVKNSNTGNQCLIATKTATGVYEFTITIPDNACFTFPILYCTSGCAESTGSLARRADGGGKQSHLRASNFDGSCNWIGEDTDCTGGGCPPLTITCPDDILTCTEYNQCGATVQYMPHVTGGCEPVTVTCDPPSGSLFAIGTDTVTCIATDANGNADTCMFIVTVEGATVCGMKYYDANVNGMRDPSEALIEGWKLTLVGGPELCPTDAVQYTGSDGVTCFTNLPLGRYTLSEVFPAGSWLATTATSCSFNLNECITDRMQFGNVCLGGGGGKTLGFWSNKNGQAQMNDGGSMVSELAMLSALCLRDGAGNDFNPANYTSFRTWILSATATNMANMLSAQLAAMKLNVEAGWVSQSSLVYAPGCGNTGLNNNFISIANLLAAAESSLCADGYTPSGDPNRTMQECLKDALDKANNDTNFVQASPCGFTTPY